jgi:NFU1 iron-sulfur cluster scaffold homolog, mitochondrial
VPYAIVEFQDTPNPNALKCVLDRPVPDPGTGALRSYAAPEDAIGDELALRLLALPGITHVLINPSWITIGKASGAEWKPIKSAVRKVLGEAD